MSVNSTNRSILANYLMGQGSSSTIGRNYVRNEFARDGVANVTASGTATVAKNTTTPLTAISDFLVTLPNNTTDYVEWTLDTLDNALKNQNCMMSFDYLSTTVGSAVQAQIVIGGTVVSTSNISTAAGQSQVRLNAPCGTLAGATTVRISNATGNTGTSSLNVANMNYGRADNVYDAPLVTQWTNYTPTITGAGTPTSVSFKQRRNGDTLEVKGTFVTGTVSAVLATVTLPTGLTIDTTKTTLQNISSTYGPNVGDWVGATANNLGMVTTATGTSTSLVYFSAQIGNANMGIPANGNTVWGTAQTVTFKFSVPISGWAAVSAVSADQTDYGDTTYTLTSSNTQGIGTPTGECQHARVSDKLKIRCKVTNGTTTASEMRINLPNSLTSADTTRIPTIQLAGYATFASANTNQFQVYIEPSVQYLTFGFQGTASGLTKQTGSAEFGTGAVYSFSAEVPIQGWSSNQRAPTLVGSVTSNSTSALRIEAGRINCSTSSSITNLFGTSWMTTPSNISSGICTTTLSSGWSAAPACTITAANTGSVGDVTWKANATSTTALTLLCVSGGAACTGGGDINITCTGSR